MEDDSSKQPKENPETTEKPAKQEIIEAEQTKKGQGTDIKITGPSFNESNIQSTAQADKDLTNSFDKAFPILIGVAVGVNVLAFFVVTWLNVSPAYYLINLVLFFGLLAIIVRKIL
jgi:hypothetical protein